jgi:hypothetical protein
VTEAFRQRSFAIFPVIWNGIHLVWTVLFVSCALGVVRLVLVLMFYWAPVAPPGAKRTADIFDNASDMIHIALMLLIHGTLRF